MFILKSLIHRIAYSIALCIITTHFHSAHARIINLPEDYASIQEAVEAASSGDVIQINQHDVYFLKENPDTTMASQRNGILIKDKNLTIIGTIPNERVKIIHSNYFIFLTSSYSNIEPTSKDNALIVQNSNVVIKNLMLNSPFIVSGYTHYPNPIQVISGKLTLDNVDITGIFKIQSDVEVINSIIIGKSNIGSSDYHVNSSKIATPAIYIYQTDSSYIRITDSEIRCNTDIGARAITFEKIRNANIHIERSYINSGTHNSYNIPSESYWIAPDRNKGLAGVFIVDCSNVVFDMHGSATTGAVRYITLIRMPER